MANTLDLEEQEQLDELKHFWSKHGNWISWLLIVILGSLAAWNGYQWWQKNQGMQASAMFDEVEKVIKTGDSSKIDRAFSDMKERFPRAYTTQQVALSVAKNHYEAKKIEESKAALKWLIDSGTDSGLVSIARLRMSAILVDAKAYDDALSVLATGVAQEFSALVADRRGDIYILQGKKSEARTQYQNAYKAFGDQSDYRRLVTFKLNALGVNPTEESKDFKDSKEVKEAAK
ncbi:MAG: hypothetical protein RIR79_2132 [Pseudomonadota bacterium]|jgi:predicted negative regulator of RcsB-dependent stress response